MHKAGFAAILGRPSVGKSTLLNTILKTKLSIASPRPQTTRHRILGILNGPDYQVCFVDTPGYLETPKDALQRTLRRQAKIAAREEPDLIVLLVGPEPPAPRDLEDLYHLSRGEAPILLALNKIDLPVLAERRAAALAAWQEKLKPAAVFELSAKTGKGVDALIAAVVERLPESPPLYDKDQLSDRWERFFAAELIREKVFDLYEEEIPHAVAVVVELYKEREGQPDEIHATLFVERDGQKGILIGKNGEMMRKLRAAAQNGIESLTGRPAKLELWVKVRANWRKDPKALREFGYFP